MSFVHGKKIYASSSEYLWCAPVLLVYLYAIVVNTRLDYAHSGIRLSK